LLAIMMMFPVPLSREADGDVGIDFLVGSLDGAAPFFALDDADDLEGVAAHAQGLAHSGFGGEKATRAVLGEDQRVGAGAPGSR